MRPRPLTPEEVQADKESAGFAARTVIDDTVGKLMFIRDKLFMDIPDGLAGALDDVEAHVERCIDLVEDLPDAPGWDPHSPVELSSASQCMGEACSCGMPSWRWKPAVRESE